MARRRWFALSLLLTSSIAFLPGCTESTPTDPARDAESSTGNTPVAVEAGESPGQPSQTGQAATIQQSVPPSVDEADTPGEAEDPLGSSSLRIQPLDPEEAMTTFQLHAGFRLELVAAEPDVTDPVAMAFDEDGRMYVAEMRGYPFPAAEGETPPGRIRLLQDCDGDGKVDRSTLFADNLSWPTGVLPWRGGVFVTAAPDILYLKDTDGDHVADVRDVVYTGFGTGNVQAVLNNLKWGPDNWVYGSGGQNGGDIRPGGQPNAVPVTIRRRAFRFHPVGRQFEPSSGGRVRFGNTFDDWGNQFMCGSSNHIIQVVFPDRYLARNPYLVVPRVSIDIAKEGPAARVHRISEPEPWRIRRTRMRETSGRRYGDSAVRHDVFTAAAGITVYRGTAYPEPFHGNVFVGDAQSNLVHRKTLTARGATFLAIRADADSEFLRSTDNWFRPVNFVNGPDGCLYLLDMYRETVEHPISIPDTLKQHLDLTSGHDRGRIYRIVPQEFQRPQPPQLSNSGTAELVAVLEDRNGWWRQTAQRLLLERQDPAAVEPLRNLAREAGLPVTRLHALWSLEGSRSLDNDTLSRALEDRDAGIREHAVRLAESRLTDSELLRQKVLALVDDPEPRVRFQTALSVSVLRHGLAIEKLARLVQRDVTDPWIRTAVLASVSTRAGALFQAVISDRSFRQGDVTVSLLEELSALVGARNEPEEVADVLHTISGEAFAKRRQLRLAIAVGLGDGFARGGNSYRELQDSQHPGVQSVAAAASRLFDEAREIASDEQQAIAERTQAVRLLAGGPVENSLEVLVELAHARHSKAIQLAAVQALSALPGARVGQALVENWRTFSPPVRGEAVEAMFRRADRLPVLFDALEAGQISAGDLEPIRKKSLLEHRDEHIRQRARELLSSQGTGDRKKVIEEYLPALEMVSDVARGRAMFEKQCSSCHRLADQGRNVGPDLATTRNRSPESLLTQILAPNLEVSPNYLNYTLVTHNGRVMTGLLAEETETSVTLRRAEGTEDKVLRSSIDELVSSGLSLMPDGLEKQINHQQMADVIRYLRTVRENSSEQNSNTQ